MRFSNYMLFCSEDSDAESTASGHSEASSASAVSNGDLSIVAMFDDLMRFMRNRRDEKIEAAFLSLAEDTKMILEKYSEAIAQCEKLQNIIDLKVRENSELEIRLNRARHLLDEERRKTQKVYREKDILEERLDQVKDLLLYDNTIKISQDAKEKLSFLNKSARENNEYGVRNLSAINEINSTGSMLSDFSVSRSEDDLDLSRYVKQSRDWKKHRASTGGEPEPAVKKRRSSASKVIEIGPTDTVRATTTVTVIKQGPITATSTIEAVPGVNGPDVNEPCPSEPVASAPPPHLVFETWNRTESPRKPPRATSTSNRPHTLQQKTMVVPDFCACCEKRIRFGKTGLKCKECRSLCHMECKDKLPLPCIPLINTPNHKNILGIISDYTPTTPPMVPALIMHCVNEIELRGFNELGLYRISASEKDVKSLKEKYLKGKNTPSINQMDIHILCGCVKDFLRSLTEPITTYRLWKDFVQAVEAEDSQDVVPAFHQCISNLPQPNRDTLAYLILHLQKVAEAPECKMPISNLAKVFGPTVVGFSSDNPNRNQLLTETRQQIAVMEQLISLPREYWQSFLNVVSHYPPSNGLQQTPSTDSLLKPDRRFFTPGSRKIKRKRVFGTPPIYT
ncbi:hypothetical protein GWI33_020506 [Rhynchophorus ferrugineus]|uniref:Rac GTPase-activating protein 1 n=1 Tax=Rhynchophorus ferrugineus TaxID=354439 RepID=A0A834HU98_RHYFE|nr:hypothetical protein GWI33_020506 [Rhynchophorus ferrugineus]